MRLNGKVALITGASRGIGHSMAKLFAQEGAKVAINFHKSEKEALDLVEEIRKQGGEAIAIKADVSNLNDIKNMIRTTLDKFGTIDILVNNAGIILSAFFLDCIDDVWDKTMEVNLKGAFLCSREVAPIMLEKKEGEDNKYLISLWIGRKISSWQHSLCCFEGWFDRFDQITCS